MGPAEKYFSLTVGQIKVTFWSPAQIAWTLVTAALAAVLQVVMVWPYVLPRGWMWVYAEGVMLGMLWDVRDRVERGARGGNGGDGRVIG